MGLDMYLYRKSECAKDIDEAVELEREFWKTAHYDENREEFIGKGERGLEEIGYWRKANMIHGWFERHCGADNCDYYPVTRKQMTELLVTCEYVLSKTKLVDGMVHNGSRMENGEWVPIMEKGRVIEDPETAEALLPTCEGFFFGSTDYDEWYVRDIEATIDILRDALQRYKRDDVFYYYPSW